MKSAYFSRMLHQNTPMINWHRKNNFYVPIYKNDTFSVCVFWNRLINSFNGSHSAQFVVQTAIWFHFWICKSLSAQNESQFVTHKPEFSCLVRFYAIKTSVYDFDIVKRFSININNDNVFIYNGFCIFLLGRTVKVSTSLYRKVRNRASLLIWF